MEDSSQPNKSLVKRRSFKVIVIGDSGVGKTCLTFRFCSGRFPGGEYTDSTIGVDFREKNLTVDKEDIRLQLWDTAGQERFRKSMVNHYYRNVDAVVLVYDVMVYDTFKGLIHWIAECEEHGITPDVVPMMIVGNKCEEDICHIPMVVKTNEAQRFADDYNMPLFETSAKDDAKADHVEAIFMTLALRLKNQKTMFKNNNKPEEGERKSVKILYKNEAYQNDQESADSWCCGLV